MAKGRHRRERGSKKLRRAKAKRPPYDRILIVTEGKKTEPNYLEEMRIERRVPNAHIRVVWAEGTQPLKVVECAEKLFRNGKEFDLVYAVFDRDDHPLDNYRNALAKASALNGKIKNDEGKAVPFVAIPSVPCFEFWLLLHYEDEQAFHHRDDIYRRLRRHLPRYSKGAKGTYEKTSALIGTATGRAVNLRRHYAAPNGGEPFTEMDLLVQVLRKPE
jgi:RloB-like protein